MGKQVFEPAPYQVISEPQQIKAFSDPLRVRVMRILSSRAATNQQLATTLGESQAKVLYHLRFLVDARLIQLVDQRIKSGNVEKYYRASARLYGLRPDTEAGPSVTESVLESAVREAVASMVLWPEKPLSYEGRRARIPTDRLAEFHLKLDSLIDEYWGGPEESPLDDEGADLMALMTVVYRFPGTDQ